MQIFRKIENGIFLINFSSFQKQKNKKKKKKIEMHSRIQFPWSVTWVWKYADHMMLVSAASMPDRDSAKHMVFISRGKGEWRIERKIRKSQINTEGLAVMFSVSWIS